MGDHAAESYGVYLGALALVFVLSFYAGMLKRRADRVNCRRWRNKIGSRRTA
jgi:hypothetical protein